MCHFTLETWASIMYWRGTIYSPKHFSEKKYDASNSIQKNLINEIANNALITQKSNIKILDRGPGRIICPTEIDPEQLRKQFVPTDSALL